VSLSLAIVLCNDAWKQSVALVSGLCW